MRLRPRADSPLHRQNPNARATRVGGPTCPALFDCRTFARRETRGKARSPPLLRAEDIGSRLASRSSPVIAPEISRRPLSLAYMSEQNLPYILELAGMAATSDDPAETVELAVRNGIPREQFDRAIEVMKRIEHPAEFVHQVYLVDGWVRGYTGIDEKPTPWILGQQAHAYYDLGQND